LLGAYLALLGDYHKKYSEFQKINYLNQLACGFEALPRRLSRVPTTVLTAWLPVLHQLLLQSVPRYFSSKSEPAIRT
ncbi:hypothetical protein TGAM01_v202384, partial [Trichoderma gamsii]